MVKAGHVVGWAGGAGRDTAAARRGAHCCRRRHVRSPAAVLLLVVTALVPSLAATAALAEAPPGTISGTVTAAYGGGTLNDACVSAYPSDDPSAPEVAGTFTADDGSYRLTLPPGSYQIEFHGDCMGGHEYATQWWSGVTDRSGASSVLVTASQEVADVDAALATSLPGRPTNLSSSPGIRAVTLTWSPPANSGATSIT